MENELQCAHCGAFDDVMLCTIAGKTQPLCPECQRAMLAQMRDTKASAGERPQINYLTGTLGALAGALIGMLLILLTMRLGYVTIIGGIVLGALTMLAFRKVGGNIDVLGIIICVLISVVVTYLAIQLNIAIMLTKEVSNINIFDALRIMPELKAQKLLDMGTYMEDVGNVYYYTGLGLVFELIPSWKKKKANKEGDELHEEN